MEAVCSSETLVSTYSSRRRYNSVDQRRQIVSRFPDCLSNLMPSPMLHIPPVISVTYYKFSSTCAVTRWLSAKWAGIKCSVTDGYTHTVLETNAFKLSQNLRPSLEHLLWSRLLVGPFIQYRTHTAEISKYASGVHNFWIALYLSEGSV
jgi:hypothetical protein